MDSEGPILDNHLHLDPEHGQGIEAVEAFARVGNETRLAILLALHDRVALGDRSDYTVPYSELREAVGEEDSGKFGYHLNRLLGEFVVTVERLLDGRLELVEALCVELLQPVEPLVGVLAERTDVRAGGRRGLHRLEVAPDGGFGGFDALTLERLLALDAREHHLAGVSLEIEPLLDGPLTLL